MKPIHNTTNRPIPGNSSLEKNTAGLTPGGGNSPITRISDNGRPAAMTGSTNGNGRDVSIIIPDPGQPSASSQVPAAETPSGSQTPTLTEVNSIRNREFPIIEGQVAGEFDTKAEKLTITFPGNPDAQSLEFTEISRLGFVRDAGDQTVFNKIKHSSQQFLRAVSPKPIFEPTGDNSFLRLHFNGGETLDLQFDNQGGIEKTLKFRGKEFKNYHNFNPSSHQITINEGDEPGSIALVNPDGTQISNDELEAWANQYIGRMGSTAVRFLGGGNVDRDNWITYASALLCSAGVGYGLSSGLNQMGNAINRALFGELGDTSYVGTGPHPERADMIIAPFEFGGALMQAIADSLTNRDYPRAGMLVETLGIHGALTGGIGGLALALGVIGSKAQLFAGWWGPSAAIVAGAALRSGAITSKSMTRTQAFLMYAAGKLAVYRSLTSIFQAATANEDGSFKFDFGNKLAVAAIQNVLNEIAILAQGEGSVFGAKKLRQDVWRDGEMLNASKDRNISVAWTDRALNAAYQGTKNTSDYLSQKFSELTGGTRSNSAGDQAGSSTEAVNNV